MPFITQCRQIPQLSFLSGRVSPLKVSVQLMWPSAWKSDSGVGIVEQVRDGSTLRIRLLMPDGDHQMVNIALAGVKSGRVASKPGETSEPYADEVRCVEGCRGWPLNPFSYRLDSSRNRDSCSDLLKYRSCPCRTQLQHLSNPPRIQAHLPPLAFSSDQVCASRRCILVTSILTTYSSAPCWQCCGTLGRQRSGQGR